MTVVLVHGNPETEAIWGPLVDALGRDDVVRLCPAGFGAPLPDDFPATYLAYRDWLEGELEGFDQPVVQRTELEEVEQSPHFFGIGFAHAKVGRVEVQLHVAYEHHLV